MMKTTSFLLAALVIGACNTNGSASSPTSSDSVTPAADGTAPTPAGSAATSSSAAADGVVFGGPSFKVGDKLTSKTQTGAGKYLAKFLYETEILAVKDGKVTKRRLKFTEARSVGKPLPVEGKTYVIEYVDGKVATTTGDGGAVPKGELGHLGVEDATAFELPKGPVKPGEVVKKDSSVTTTFEKRDGEIGIFKTILTEKGAPETTCESTVRIKDGRLLSTKCSTMIDGSPAAETTNEYTYH